MGEVVGTIQELKRQLKESERSGKVLISFTLAKQLLEVFGTNEAEHHRRTALEPAPMMPSMTYRPTKGGDKQ